MRVFSWDGALTKVRDLDHLLDVAARLFGEQGYDGTRLEDIADELGVLKGSLYYYTSSKFELLQKVNARRLQRLVEQATVIAHSDLAADERLEQILKMHLTTIDEFYPESSQWFAGNFVRRGEPEAPPTNSYHQDYAHLLAELIEDGQAAGLFRSDLDPTIATLTVLGATNWLTLWYEKGGRLAIEEIAEQIAAVILGGLRARPSTRTGSRARTARKEASRS